ncbi:phosphatidylserine decarboxylase, partial [Conglomerata obtusa]
IIDFQELNTDLNNFVISTNIQAIKNKCDVENTNEIININATTDISTDINVTTQMEIYIVCVKLSLETTSTFIVKFQTGNTAVKKIITEDHKFPIFIKKNEDINDDTELILKVSEKRFLRNRVIHKIETSQWIGTHKCGAVKIKITKDEDVIFPGLFKKSIVCRSDYLNALLGIELNNLSFFDKTLQYFNFGNSKWALPDAKIFIKDMRTDKLMQEKMYKKVKFYLTFLYTKRLAESRFYRRLIRKMTENVGLKFGTEKSVELIQPFIDYFQIDMTECEEPVYNFRSFNEFFIRKLKHLARVVENINGVSSPADSRVVAFRTLEEARGVWIKGSRFSVEALIGMRNTNLNAGCNTKCNSSDCKYECSYNEDSNCKATSMSIFICRLAPQDYHRFHSPVKGIIKSIKNINGDYLTVHPVSVRKTNVLTENIRTVLEIESNFGTCYVIAIGAALVGSITITVNENDHVEAMSELGYFEFGGSTVVVLFKRQLRINNYILRNSLTGIETLIRVGDCIAE